MVLTANRKQQIKLFHTFKTALASLKGKARMISLRELPEALAEIIVEENIARLVVAESLLLKPGDPAWLPSTPATTVSWIGREKAADFNDKTYRRILAEADAAISSANYLIADTGSILLLDKDHPAKLTTILPPTLIVIAGLNTLIATLNKVTEVPETFGTAQNGSFFCISGPSRTADIEKVLVLGVHGPKKLHVLVVNNGS